LKTYKLQKIEIEISLFTLMVAISALKGLNDSPNVSALTFPDLMAPSSSTQANHSFWADTEALSPSALASSAAESP